MAENLTGSKPKKEGKKEIEVTSYYSENGKDFDEIMKEILNLKLSKPPKNN